MRSQAPGSVPDATAERTATNSLFSLASFFTTAAFVAVTTPFLVHHLGAEQYGIFSLSLTLVTFLTLLDAGISTALVRFVADRTALGDMAGVNRLVTASFVLYFALGLLAVATTAVVATHFIGDVFNLSPAGIAPARFVFLFAGIAFFFTFLSKIFMSVILGLQRNDIAAILKILVTITTGTGTLVLISLGFGVRSLLLLSTAVGALSLCTYALVARRQLPQLSLRTKPSRAVLLSTLKFSGWISLANTTAFLLFQLDRVVLGMLKSVSLVTYYAVPGSVASYLYVATANLASITIAVATGLFARRQQDRVVQLYLRATRFIVMFLLAAGIPAFVLARPILAFWIGDSFAERSTGILRILVATYVLLGLAVMPYNVILAAGRPRVLGLVNLAMLGTNIVLIAILIPPFGILGAAWAYLLSVTPLLFVLFYAERHLLDLSLTHWLALLRRMAVPAALATAFSLLMLQLVSNLVEVLAAAAGAAALLVLLYVTCFAETDDRRLVKRLLRLVPS
jgi:O-antigen/teichoic acid export membrane protein